MGDDVANPERVWVDEKCYRKNPCRNNYITGPCAVDSEVSMPSSRVPLPGSSTNLPPYKEYEMDGSGPDENGGEGEYVIEEVKSTGGFETRCGEIPKTLHAAIIGMKGSVKKRIESETSTKIIIPRINEQGDIVIRGKKRECVVRARRRIESITLQARFRREATHFLSFPLNSKAVVDRVREFKDKILAEFKDEGLGIDEKLFQDPEKIHLTLSVLMLLDEAERKKAADILQAIKPELKEISKRGILRFRLQGLEIMNDDPTQVNILFAKCLIPEYTNTLQEMGDFIHSKFLDSGYAKSSRSDSVKLHATLMNTRYRQQDESQGTDEGNGGNRKGNRFDRTDTFNAKPILTKYHDYDFGFVEVKEIHISTRHTKGSDGYYKPYVKCPLTD